MRSLNEPRCKPWTRGGTGGASIFGITGTSIFGTAGGGGSGGLYCEPPGGMNCCCAEAELAATSANITAPRRIDDRFMRGYVVIPSRNRKEIVPKLFFRRVLDRIEAVGFEAQQVP